MNKVLLVLDMLHLQHALRGKRKLNLYPNTKCQDNQSIYKNRYYPSLYSLRLNLSNGPKDFRRVYLDFSDVNLEQHPTWSWEINVFRMLKRVKAKQSLLRQRSN